MLFNSLGSLIHLDYLYLLKYLICISEGDFLFRLRKNARKCLVET